MTLKIAVLTAFAALSALAQQNLMQFQGENIAQGSKGASVSYRNGEQLQMEIANQSAINIKTCVLFSSQATAWLDLSKPSPAFTLQRTNVFFTMECRDLGNILQSAIVAFTYDTTAIPVPTFVPDAVTDAASHETIANASPGDLITLYGAYLATGIAKAPGATPTTPLPTDLMGTSVLLNGTPARLLYVSPNQVNFQMISDLGIGQRVSIAVRTAAGTSNAVNIALTPYQPRLYAFDNAGNIIVQDANVKDHAAFVGTGTNPPVQASGPVRAALTVYGNGFGILTNPVPNGFPSPTNPLSYCVVNVTATLEDGRAIDVLYCGGAPAAIQGQINLLLPAFLARARHTIAINFGTGALAGKIPPFSIITD